MNMYLQVALATTAWCFFHSFFVTHAWRDLVRRAFPSLAAYNRLVYVLASSISAGILFWWLSTLPQTTIWAWTGLWQVVRVVGLIEALLLFWLGARAHDGRTFLGLRQLTAGSTEKLPSAQPLSTSGVLGLMRHPWYTGTLISLVFMLPYSDVNLVWRGVFIVYTFIGTELEERKLMRELGDEYLDYQKRVPRFFPVRKKRSRAGSTD